MIELGTEIARELAMRVVSLSRLVTEAKIAGIVEVVPTFRSLMIHYDPLKISGQVLEDRLGALLAEDLGNLPAARQWTIPVCYHPSLAPDLLDVAERTGLSPDDVIERHSQTDYFVYMIGFLPGYPYLGDVAPELVLPRRENPRTRVPPGSVAIAQRLTAIYTLETPGGWHLIGRTPVCLFDAGRAEPALLTPGDSVRFEPIALDDYERLTEAISDDRYELQPEGAAA